MTQEEKQLLLVDLCGRLPYGVMVRVEGEKYFNETKEPYITNLSLNNYILDYDDVTIIPYLRSISNMTEDEVEEWERIVDVTQNWLRIDSIPNAVNFFNKHHLDYHNLIEKGLALEAPTDMYKTE